MREKREVKEKPQMTEKAENMNDNLQTTEKKMSMEEAFEELDTIVERLEGGEASLEESFRIYQKGMELLKYCSEKIDTVEKKMMKLNENGELSEF